MSINDVILAEMAVEAETTKGLFERIPEDKLSWRPHKKSRSLGQLALHIAQLPAVVCSLAELDVAEPPSLGNEPEAKSRKELMQTFDQSMASAREQLTKMDDERMLSPWTLQNHGKTIMSMPRTAFLRSILLNHNYHHRGQLTVYLRLLDVPLPFVYGPSADENPFVAQ